MPGALYNYPVGNKEDTLRPGEGTTLSDDRGQVGDQRAAFRILQRHSTSLASSLSHQFHWAVVAAILALVGGWMIVSRTGPAMAQLYWDQFLIARKAMLEQASVTQNAAVADPKTQGEWVACLENVVHWQPTHASAHLALAETYRRLFDQVQSVSDNPMSLDDVRDAAIRSQFKSRDALVDWLSRAVGEHWVHLERAGEHTRKALALCPLQGRGYLYLADLSFLSGADDVFTRACIEQALKVRPADGTVLCAAAAEALRAGDAQQWLDYSKRAFRQGRRQQQQLIHGLITCTPTSDLPATMEFLVREFDPDSAGLRCLYDACQGRCSAAQLAPLLEYRAKKAEAEAALLSPTAAAPMWLEARQLYSQLGDNLGALKCARSAAKCDPGNFDVHYQLALCLLNDQLFSEAEWHLRWCLQRSPGNAAAEAKFREALKGRLDGARRATTEGEPLISR